IRETQGNVSGDDPTCPRLRPTETADERQHSQSWGRLGWSKRPFSQFCRMAGVSNDTINRLSSQTVKQALQETLPVAEKPLEILTMGQMTRSVQSGPRDC